MLYRSLGTRAAKLSSFFHKQRDDADSWDKAAYTIRPSTQSAAIDEVALRTRLSSLLAREMAATKHADAVPSLRRKWVRAPLSRLSTAASRLDWFRVMHFNFMVNSWDKAHPTTPVQGVCVRVPAFTRGIESDEFCDYDESVDTELPPFLRDSFRRKHLVNLLRYYDPDIVCLNEVNRPFFHGEMWRYVRFLGYGTLYQSSRGAAVETLGPGAPLHVPRKRGRIAAHEDIGNVILFHKSRFVPILMPGPELHKHLHFAHLVALRDKVTNMTVNTACVQLTAGEGCEAAALRAHEMDQLFQVLDAMSRNDSDRAHMTTLICGDFNNREEEEQCVQKMRDRYFSTYDIVGGPRWTTWFFNDQHYSEAYQQYYAKNLAYMHRSNVKHQARRMIERFRRRDTIDHGPSSRMDLCRQVDDTLQSNYTPHTHLLQAGSALQHATPPVATAEGRDTQAATLSPTEDTQSRNVVVHRTQDYIFYDPQILSLHQTLDIPENDELDMRQLLPSSKLPSHHLPLFVDVSYNNVNPDVAALSNRS